MPAPWQPAAAVCMSCEVQPALLLKQKMLSPRALQPAAGPTAPCSLRTMQPAAARRVAGVAGAAAAGCSAPDSACSLSAPVGGVAVARPQFLQLPI